jgi:hypothetical protein
MGSAVLRTRRNVTFENNVIHDVRTHCLNLYDTEALIVRNNTCWNTGYGLWLRDETLSPDTHTTGAQIYNNVFGPTTRISYSVTNEIATFSDWGDEDHNLIAARLSTQTFSATDLLDLSTDAVAALLQAPSSLDFAPSSGSPLIDAGRLGLGDPVTDFLGQPRPVGAEPDIGAVETQ